MREKNRFSNYNEVIKIISGTQTLLYTASLPLPPLQVSLVFTKESWGDYLSLITPGSICKCTNTLKISVCQLLSSTCYTLFLKGLRKM